MGGEAIPGCAISQLSPFGAETNKRRLVASTGAEANGGRQSDLTGWLVEWDVTRGGRLHDGGVAQRMIPCNPASIGFCRERHAPNTSLAAACKQVN